MTTTEKVDGIFRSLVRGQAKVSNLPEGFSEALFPAADHRSLWSIVRQHAGNEAAMFDAMTEEQQQNMRQILAHAPDLNGQFREACISLMDRNAPATSLPVMGPTSEEHEAVTPRERGQSAPFQFTTVENGERMQTMELDVPTDLISGIARSSSLVFLAGEEGVGKSLFAMNFGVAVATGATSFLHWTLENTGPVIYLNAELYHDEFVFRFRLMAKTTPGPQPLSNFIVPAPVPLLRECLPTLEELITSCRPRLVVTDPLYWVNDANEADNSEMREFMRTLVELRDRFGVCIFVVHHTRKGGKNQLADAHMMRGAGAMCAAADTILMLRRSGKDKVVRVLTVVKLRHARDDNQQPHGITLNPETLTFCDIGVVDEAEEMRSETDDIDIRDLFHEGEAVKSNVLIQRGEHIGMRRASVFRHLKEAVRAGTLIRLSHGEYCLPSPQNELSPRNTNESLKVSSPIRK